MVRSDKGAAGVMFTLDTESGFDQVVFIKAVRHDLSAGSYIMEVTVGFSDPWLADRRKARVVNARAAADRRRRAAKAKASHPKPKKAKVRSSA